MVPGIFRSGLVNPFRTGEMGEAICYRLRVQLSYRVRDLEHPGEYVHEFSTEDEAVALMRSMEQGPFYFRYNPVSPSDCAIDPYRDVWAPQARDSGGAAPAAVTEIRRGGIPVSLGQMLIVNVGAILLLYKTSGPRFIFWLFAGGHALAAVTTTGCCWWSSTETRLTVWVGRLALALVACGWILAARFPILTR